MTGYALTRRRSGSRSAGKPRVEPGGDPRLATLGSGNSGRILLAIAVMIAVLGGAVAISIWRYQVALDGAAQADLAHNEEIQVAQATTHFWHQNETANEYFLGIAEAPKEVDAEAAAFALVQKGLAPTPPKSRRWSRKRRRQMCLRRDLQTAPRSLRAACSGERARSAQRARERVLAPLEALQESSAGAAHKAEAAAGSAAGQALAVSIVAGLLAVLGGVAFAVFALRLVGRMGRREEKLQDLVGHVRSTLGMLSGVSTELRSAAQESAAATTEQSAAVAQTSATIEELAATEPRSPTTPARSRPRRRRPATRCATCRRRSKRSPSGRCR